MSRSIMALFGVALSAMCILGCGGGVAVDTDGGDEPGIQRPSDDGPQTPNRTPDKPIDKPASPKFASGFVPPEVEYKTPTGEPDIDEPIDAATNVIFEQSYRDENIPKIEAFLESRNPLIRARAADVVRGSSEEVGKKLRALLVDPNVEVRREAAGAFNSKPDLAIAHADALIVAAFDADEDVGERAMYALDGLEEPPADHIKALTALLAHTEDNRGKYAARILGDIGPDAKEATPALLSALEDYHFSDEAAVALAKMGRADVLIQRLKTEEDSSAIKALATVDPTTDEIVSTISRHAKSERVWVRNEVIKGLGNAHPVGEKAMVIIVNAINSSEASDREAAVEALGAAEPKTEAGATLLLRAMSDKEEAVKSQAAKSFASYSLDDRKLVEGVLNAAAKDDFTSHFSLHYSLEEADDVITPVLTEIVLDEKAPVATRAMAVWLVSEIDEYDEDFKAAVTKVVSKEDVPAEINGYAAILLDEDHPNRTAAMIAGLKQQQIAHLRFAIAEAMGGSYAALEVSPAERDQIVPSLIENVKESNYEYAAKAIETLGQLKAKAGVPVLIRIVEKMPKETNYSDNRFTYAISSLGKIGPDAAASVPALLAQLKTTGGGNIGEIAAALAQIVPESDVDPDAVAADLLSVLQDKERLKFAHLGAGNLANALAALPIKHTPKMVSAITKILDEPDGWEAGYAVNALSQIGPAAKSAAPALMKYCEAKAKKDEYDAVGSGALALAKIEADPKVTVPLIAGYSEANTKKTEYVAGKFLSALAIIGGEEEGVVPAILTQLEAVDSGTRLRAAKALAEIGADNEAAMNALIQMVKSDPKDSNRSEALNLVWKVAPKDKRVVALVVASFAEEGYTYGGLYRSLGKEAPVIAAAAMAHEDEAVREGIAEWASRIDDPTLQNALSAAALDGDDEEARWEAAERIGSASEYEEQVFPIALANLSNNRRRYDASEIINGYGIKGVKRIYAIALDESAEVQQRINALRGIADEYQWQKTVFMLKPLVQHENKELAGWAAVATSRLPGKLNSTALLAAFDIDNPDLTRAIINQLYNSSRIDEADLLKIKSKLFAFVSDKDGDEDVADSAASLLGSLEMTDVQKGTLVPMLSNPDLSARALQVFANMEEPPESAIGPIVKGISENEEFLDWAPDVLANIGAPAAPALIKLAADADAEEEVRQTAAKALMQLETVPADQLDLLKPLVSGESELIGAFAAARLAKSGVAGKEVVTALIKAADSDDYQVGNALRMALDKMGDKGEPVVVGIISRMQMATADEKSVLVNALVNCAPESPLALKALAAEFAATEDEDALSNFVYSFSEHGAAALPYLTPMLDSDQPVKVKAAITAINNLLYSEIEEEEKKKLAARFVALTDHKDESVAAKAANTLARLDASNTKAVPVLVAALQSDDSRTRSEAIEAVNMIGPPATAATGSLIDLLDYDRHRSEALRALAKVNPTAAVPKLIENLDSEYDFDTAASALGEIGEPASAAVPALLATLDDSEKVSTAAYVLSNLGEAGEPAIALLITQLKDPFRAAQAADALGRFDERSAPAVGELTALLDSPDPNAVRGSIYVLRRIGDAAEPATPKLIAIFNGDSDYLSGIAANALGQIKSPAALAALLAAVNGDHEVKGAAIAAVAQYGEEAKPAFPAIFAALKDEDLRSSALSAVYQLGPLAAEATGNLVPLLSDEEEYVRYRAADALAEIGPGAKAALPELEAMLKDDEEYVVQSAGAAIWKIDPEKAAELKIENPEED